MKNKHIFLDSNIFIYFFEENPSFFRITEKIFEGLQTGKYTGITSVISLTELLSFKIPPDKTAILEQAFLEVPHLTVYEINQTIAIEAARIRRVYGYRLPDSIQLATCLYAKGQSFITNDRNLKSFKELNIVLLKQLK